MKKKKVRRDDRTKDEGTYGGVPKLLRSVEEMLLVEIVVSIPHGNRNRTTSHSEAEVVRIPVLDSIA